MKKIKAAGNNKLYILVDARDYKDVSRYKWSITRGGYALRAYRINGKLKNIYLHRYLLNAQKGQEIDHINHNRLDNRKTNLRFCTRTQNNGNHSLRSNNTSGYKGVTAVKEKWVAQLRTLVDGKPKKVYLGTFTDKIEAARAYNKGATKYFGEFANLNKV